jgi:GntR family transcriptional regulator
LTLPEPEVTIEAEPEAIRPAQPEDAEAIAEIHIASFRAVYHGILPPTALESLDTATRAAIWSQRIAEGDGEVLVAFSGDQALGFVWLGATPDADDDAAKVGAVRSIHVRPSHTGKGIGQVLLAASRQSLRRAGFTVATLWVVSENDRARKVYVLDGWSLDGATRREPIGLQGEGMPLATVERFRRRLTHDEPPSEPSHRLPKSYTIKQYLRRQIEGSAPGTPLPPERALSEDLGASRATVRQALLELAVEGRIVRMQGRGTFVAPPKETSALRLRSFSADWAARGRQTSTRVIESRTEPAEPDVAEQLQIGPEASVYVIERLRLVDDIPTSFEITHLDASRFPGLPALLGEDVSLYELLRERWGVEARSAEQTIETVLASPQVTHLLQADAGTPVLLLTRLTIGSDGLPFELARSVYRGDRYRFATTLTQ